MAEIIRLPGARPLSPPRRVLQPIITWRDCLANAFWLIVGIPISLGLLALQIVSIFGWPLF